MNIGYQQSPAWRFDRREFPDTALSRACRVRAALTRHDRQGYPDGMSASTDNDNPTGADRLGSLCCSFCTKDKDSVSKLIAGPGVYICNECIDLCNEILATDIKPEEIRPRRELPDDELLESLARAQAVAPQVDAVMHEYVDILRSR